MPVHCFPCNRSFVSQQAFDQHKQFSATHKAATRKASPQKLPVIRTVGVVQAPPLNKKTPGPSQRNTATPRSVIPEVRDDVEAGTSLDNRIPWSVIPTSQQPELLGALISHCHAPEQLLANKYLLRPYTTEDLAGLRKCKDCGSLQKNTLHGASSQCRFHPGKRVTAKQMGGPKLFSCCGSTDRGCVSLFRHRFSDPGPIPTARYRSFERTPPASPQKQTFRAVVLDCEMVGVLGGVGEAILICVADYFTGAILLNKLINPTETVISWRSSIHGIECSTLQAAVAQGQALSGWKEARAELWKFIDSDTIIVGHALQHDLDVLRMVHDRVVDSAILSRNGVGLTRQWGLKVLCQDMLNIELRDNKGGVHNCMEDVLATREVVLWCTRNQRDLKAWAAIKRLEEVRRLEEVKKAQQARHIERAKLERLKAQNEKSEASDEDVDSDSEDDEVLHWSDIAEDLGWPHLDTTRGQIRHQANETDQP